MRREALGAVTILSLAGCEVGLALPQPVIDSVTPPSWRAVETPRLTIEGSNFSVRMRSTIENRRGVDATPRFHGTLGEIDLASVHWIDNHTLEAEPPADLSSGVYDLTIVGPGGAATLSDAVRILPPTNVSGRDGGGTIPVDQLSVTIPVPEVDPDISLLFFNYTHDGDEPNSGMVSGQLASDGRSVTFERASTLLNLTVLPANVTVEIRFAILSLPGIQVFRGVEPLANRATVLVPLPRPVSLDRSFVLASARNYGHAFSEDDWLPVRLTPDGANLDLSTRDSCCSMVAAWQVAEFPPDFDAVVRTGSAFLDLLTDTVTVTLSPPAIAQNALLLFTSEVTDTVDLTVSFGECAVGGRLVGNDTLVFDRAVASSMFQVDIAWQLVEWSALSVQRGSADFANQDVEVRVSLAPSVDPSRAVSLLPGHQRQGTSPLINDDHAGISWFTTELVDGGATLMIRRGWRGAPATAHWTVVEVAP